MKVYDYEIRYPKIKGEKLQIIESECIVEDDTKQYWEIRFNTDNKKSPFVINKDDLNKIIYVKSDDIIAAYVSTEKMTINNFKIKLAQDMLDL